MSSPQKPGDRTSVVAQPANRDLNLLDHSVASAKDGCTRFAPASEYCAYLASELAAAGTQANVSSISISVPRRNRFNSNVVVTGLDSSVRISWIGENCWAQSVPPRSRSQRVLLSSILTSRTLELLHKCLLNEISHTNCSARTARAGASRPPCAISNNLVTST